MLPYLCKNIISGSCSSVRPLLKKVRLQTWLMRTLVCSQRKIFINYLLRGFWYQHTGILRQKQSKKNLI